MAMKHVALSLLLTALLSAPGCARKAEAPAEAEVLEAEFPVKPSPVAPADAPTIMPLNAGTPPPPPVQQQVSAVSRQIRAGDWYNAATQLHRIQAATNLTGDQLRAIHQTTIMVQQRLAERAATGDPKAVREWEEYQKSLTR
jgi:DNA-binding transcriptional regulator YiaG